MPAPWLTMIKSAIQVEKLKNSYNYSSQYTWKSKFYCSSTYRLQALGFRPLIGSIIAEGINGMTPWLSGTHTLNDQKRLLLPKLTSPKEQYQHLGKGSKYSTWQSKTITQRRMLSSAFSWWDFGEVQKEEVEGKEKKNPSPITATLKRFGSSLDSVWGVVWMERWQKRGKWIIDSNYTGLRFSALCVTGLFSVLSL